MEVERIQEREDLVADLDRLRSSVGSLKDRFLALADSTMGKLEELESDVVAAQPEEDEAEPVTDGRTDLREIDDEFDHDVESDTEADPDSGEDSGESVEEPTQQDEQEEPTGQVFLGSGRRPWDRGDPEG